MSRIQNHSFSLTLALLVILLSSFVFFSAFKTLTSSKNNLFMIPAESLNGKHVYYFKLNSKCIGHLESFFGMEKDFLTLSHTTSLFVSLKQKKAEIILKGFFQFNTLNQLIASYNELFFLNRKYEFVSAGSLPIQFSLTEIASKGRNNLFKASFKGPLTLNPVSRKFYSLEHPTLQSLINTESYISSKHITTELGLSTSETKCESEEFSALSLEELYSALPALHPLIATVEKS